MGLLRGQAEQADARQALLAAQNNAALALVDLRTVLGVSQASDIGLSQSLDGIAASGAALPATLQDALRQAEAHRPELGAAQKLVEAAQSGVGAARGGYAPQVYSVARGDATAGQDLGRAGYTIGLTASLPLYDGGRRRADVDGAQARLDRARGGPSPAPRPWGHQQVPRSRVLREESRGRVPNARATPTARGTENLEP